MSDIRPLKGRHEGCPAAILGGGVSLPQHLKAVPKNAVLLSVNRRGALLTRCDYIVATDRPEAEECQRLFPDTPLISPFHDLGGHWYVRNSDVIDSGFSSPVAMWLARFMGCAPVILCGMDCYQGGTYWYDKEAESSGNHQPLQNQLIAWRVAYRQTPGVEHVKAAGGPLVEIFGEYRTTTPAGA